MQYAHDRNIAFYVVTWNIYTYGVDGKYGITDALDNPKTVDYFRASVREMFRTYPLLAGIGLTAGENMGDASAYYSGGTDSFDAKENWLLATYGQGVLDAARAEPQRQFRLIHRQHETRAQDIATTFKPVIAQPNVDFVFSFKYAQAHAAVVDHADLSPWLSRIAGQPQDALDAAQRRRADAALGGAGFRARIRRRTFRTRNRRATTSARTCGCGAANSCRARRAAPRQLEIDKHWLHFLLWGRLGYDPTLDDERIARAGRAALSRRRRRRSCSPPGRTRR